MTDTLHALSPLDGRYAEATRPLTEFFSEFAFLRDRVRVELNYLAALSKTGMVRPLTDSESARNKIHPCQFLKRRRRINSRL
ncbi:MAG: hypothetical protein U0Z26_17430 [Anaerolineales bacterium]